jgi:hypothetical protein
MAEDELKCAKGRDMVKGKERRFITWHGWSKNSGLKEDRFI